jgi:hypothetical protein
LHHALELTVLEDRHRLEPDEPSLASVVLQPEGRLVHLAVGVLGLDPFGPVVGVCPVWVLNDPIGEGLDPVAVPVTAEVLVGPDHLLGGEPEQRFQPRAPLDDRVLGVERVGRDRKRVENRSQIGGEFGCRLRRRVCGGCPHR